MKHLITRMAVVAPVIAMITVLSGCSSQSKPQASGDPNTYALSMQGVPSQTAADQTLKTLQAMPADQRQQYIDAHPETIQQIQDDPDKSKAQQFRDLVSERTP